MKNDLIERYIYAVTKQLPKKNREDVAMELRCLIDDMLAERCGEQEPGDKDIRVVLTELGTPRELYAKYDEDADKCLIGQPYYSTYKLALKAILAAIVGGLAIACVILQFLNPQSWGAFAGDLLENLLEGALVGYTAVTLVFTVMQAKGMKLSENFSFDDLPSVPKKSQEISKWESFVGVGFCVLFVILFVFTPEVLCVVHEGTAVAMFDLEAIRQTWFIVVAFAVCGIIREVMQLMEGRYNEKVMVTALATNVISAGLSIWWLRGFQLINPVFLSNMKEIFAGESGIVFSIFGNFEVFFLGFVLFALVLDSIEVTVKTLRK